VEPDDAEIQRAIRDACFDEEPDYTGLPARVAVYRQLVRNTLHSVAHKLLPRTHELLGDAFDRDFARFLAARGPSTHYLRDVPHEFVAWAAPRWTDPPWAADLARHEMASFAVATVPYVAEPKAEEIALDKALLLSSLSRLERFEYAVHEEASPPAARAIAVLYYRDEAHDLRTLELTPLAAAIVERKDLPLRDAIAAACQATSVPMNDEALASIARFLADLGERGVLLGAR
jgi:hypothetical protein